MNYTLEYLPQVKKDMDEIAAYVGVKLGNPEAADRLINEMLDKAEALVDMPYKYSVYISRFPLKFEFRKIIVGSYAMFYYVDDVKNLITVARVIYAKRDIDNFLR